MTWEPRKYILHIRFSENEAEQLQSKAREVGTTLSDFIRRSALAAAGIEDMPKPSAQLLLLDPEGF